MLQLYIISIPGANEYDDFSPPPTKNDDPWNQHRSTMTTTTTIPSSNFPREDARTAPNNNVTQTSKPIAKLVGDDRFMANPTTTTASEQSRPRWRFKRKKKEKYSTGASSAIGKRLYDLNPGC